MARQTCLACGEPLVPDPVRKHWAHCPKCNPRWAKYVYSLHKDAYDREFAHKAASDTRGKPTIGGEKA